MSTARWESGLWRSGLPWFFVVGTVVAVLVLSGRASAPPPPLGRAAPAHSFSEARARDIVGQLSEGIGRRVNGTQGYVQAADYLAAELRKIPGVEVETQQGAGTHIHRLFPSLPRVYRTTNVLGRLPGKSSDAILLDAHFDTLVDSVGAADDAAGVACVLETLRALALEAPLDRTIVVSLNGGEEMGQLGAAAFMEHAWAKDVRAYIYLEALPGGRAALIGAGPGNPWLASLYARAVRAPLGNVLGQELAQSGLLPFNGDFVEFHKAGWPGLDVAMVGDAWAVHTRLDRMERLQGGGLQHMGDATLATTRALASASTRLTPDPRRSVYYDLLGITMIAYPSSVARWLGAGALIAFAALLLRARRRRLLSLPSVLAAGAWNGLGLVVGVLSALLPALLLKLVLHRSQGWFSKPGLVVACFALPAAAGMMWVHGRWRARALRKMNGDNDRVALTGGMGALLFWAFWLLLATLGGAGTGYVSLFWVAGGALGLVLATAARPARLAGALVGLVPGAIVTIEVAALIVANIVPMAGMTPESVPADLVVAVLVGLATGLVGVVALTLPDVRGGFGKAALVCAVLGIVGIALTALANPYSALRPKRVVAVHATVAGDSALLLASPGADGMRPLAALFPDASPVPATWPSLEPFVPPFTHKLPAPAQAMQAPSAAVTAEAYDAGTDARQVALHLLGTSPQLELAIPAQSLVAWSIAASLANLTPTQGRYLVRFEGVPAAGVDIQLTLRGPGPVEIELLAIDGAPASGPAIEALARRLPAWTTLISYSYRTARVKL
jgi:hypothetical protein